MSRTNRFHELMKNQTSVEVNPQLEELLQHTEINDPLDDKLVITLSAKQVRLIQAILLEKAPDSEIDTIYDEFDKKLYVKMSHEEWLQEFEPIKLPAKAELPTEGQLWLGNNLEDYIGSSNTQAIRLQQILTASPGGIKNGLELHIYHSKRPVPELLTVYISKN